MAVVRLHGEVRAANLNLNGHFQRTTAYAEYTVNHSDSDHPLPSRTTGAATCSKPDMAWLTRSHPSLSLSLGLRCRLDFGSNHVE